MRIFGIFETSLRIHRQWKSLSLQLSFAWCSKMSASFWFSQIRFCHYHLATWIDLLLYATVDTTQVCKHLCIFATFLRFGSVLHLPNTRSHSHTTAQRNEVNKRRQNELSVILNKPYVKHFIGHTVYIQIRLTQEQNLALTFTVSVFRTASEFSKNFAYSQANPTWIESMVHEI